jgi:hypothetical protein
MKLPVLLLTLAFAGPAVPVFAEDAYPSGTVPMRALAPADEYFGHARMSVLGIANTIRDAGARLAEGAPPPSMVDGPLSFVADAIRDWERQFPRDPWIARDLYALETVYLRAHTAEAFALARATENWLIRDYPDARATRDARLALGDLPDEEGPFTVDAWGRFADLRAPLPSPH